MNILLLTLACASTPDAPVEDAIADVALSEAPVAEEAAAEEPAPAEEAAPVSRPAVDPIVINSDAGDITVTPVYHGSVHVDVAGRSVWIDPWSKADLSQKPKADLLLITDIHFDHDDSDAAAMVTTDGTAMVAPQAVADAKEGREVQHVLANGDTLELDGLTITAVPMYNLTRGPEEGGLFHDKGRGNGYLLTFGGKTLYFSGDTACTEEMKALTGVDHAFVTMNLPYTMPPEEAAVCVAAFRPKSVTPYHYAGSDLTVFAAGLAEVEGVEVVQAEFYPGGLPWSRAGLGR